MTKTNPHPIIAALVELRQRKGVTTYQLAEQTGMHRQAISRIENGRTSPSLTTLDTLTAALGATIELKER